MSLAPAKKSGSEQGKYKNIMMVDLELEGRNIAYDVFADFRASPPPNPYPNPLSTRRKVGRQRIPRSRFLELWLIAAIVR